ncbi:MAG TPA: TonB-dependent receptor [Chitinophagaceae bacterium]|nr:TonB-dependent receptor [Chitinophagaceae bacterium]
MKSSFKLRILASVVTMLCSSLVFAQNTVSGKVSDNSGKGISGASVTAGGGRGTSTDADGNYSLSLPNGSVTITASFVGFASVSKTVTVSGNTTIDFLLVEAAGELDEVILTTGTRALPRSSINTPLPIDALHSADLKSTAQISFDKQLQYRVPSFNTINTPVNDATTLLDPYEIRNLGPSRTLILINGKRKNLSSLLYVQFAPGRGETGADLSAIPVDAIKRVEILRDGASAQYGSDAIAGVMNVILKDRVPYSTLTFNGGVTHKGDGETYGLAYNGGSNFGSTGFINYTIDFSQVNDATRSGTVHRPTEKATFGGTAAADAAIDAFLNVYPTAGNINGTGETQAAKFNYNLGLPVGDNSQFYSNAALVFKKVYSHANYRPPYWRLDYGLLHTPIPGAPNYTGGTDPLYEGYIGYVPTFDGDLLDYNGTFGFNSTKGGWKHDASITFGGNQQLYTVENTVNASIGTASPTFFKPGGFRFSHIVGNYDISKSVSDQLSIAFGTEVRSETYRIIAGDTASYSGEGANSFPGIREENATTNSRFNLGAYIDASWDISDAFLLNGAVRAEKYSDYGSSFVWKASSRYKFAGDKVVVRASISTGFRAPSLHQIYAQSTQAGFFNGLVQLSGLFNNRSKQAFLLGIPRLKEEESTNFTVGLGLNPVKNFNITLDYYNINIQDRIVLSSSIRSNDPTSQLYQILQQAGVVNIQFFINGIETRTQGLDLVANYRNIALGGGLLAINLAGNYTLSNEIIGTPNDPPAIADAGSTILSTQIRSILTESRPEYKAVLGFDYKMNKFGVSLNNTVFGPTRFQDLDNGGAVMNNIKQEFKTAVVTDLNLGYDFTSRISAYIAANNIFNVLPKWDLKLTGSPGDPNYAAAEATLNNTADRELLEGFLSFSGRYPVLAYNGSQFSQLGTIFQASLVFRF